MQNDIALFTNNPEAKGKGEQSFTISTAGEYEVKDIFIYGLPADPGGSNKDGLIYLIETEGIHLAHLGKIKSTKLSEKQLERLEGVDILILPVGGSDGLKAEAAAELISELEPRVVIPMNYQLPGLKVKLDSLDSFKKAVGGNFETIDKYKVSRKDLPEEETNFIIIEPSTN